MDPILDRARHEQVRNAARWLGIGVGAAPALDVADRSGLMTALADPSTFTFAAMGGAAALVALFVGLGIGAATLLPRHDPRSRRTFFATCAIPVLAWILYGGLRWVALIALLALVLSYVRLRHSAQ